jgi:hypothetical protein
VTILQAPRPRRSHRKKAQNRSLTIGLLTAVAALGSALIVVITVPALLGATSSRDGRNPMPTVTVKVTVKVPAPQTVRTVTVSRPGPTITVTVKQPAHTVTIHCPHPGRGCGHD